MKTATRFRSEVLLERRSSRRSSAQSSTGLQAVGEPPANERKRDGRRAVRARRRKRNDFVRRNDHQKLPHDRARVRPTETTKLSEGPLASLEANHSKRDAFAQLGILRRVGASTRIRKRNQGLRGRAGIPIWPPCSNLSSLPIPLSHSILTARQRDPGRQRRATPACSTTILARSATSPNGSDPASFGSTSNAVVEAPVPAPASSSPPTDWRSPTPMSCRARASWR